MAKTSKTSPSSSKKPVRASADVKRFIPCDNGRYAYLNAGGRSVHRQVGAPLAEAVTAAVAADPAEQKAILGYAETMQARYPDAPWDVVVAAATPAEDAA